MHNASRSTRSQTATVPKTGSAYFRRRASTSSIVCVA